MEPAIITELALASATILAAVLVGFRGQGSMGAVMLGFGTVLASALCISGTWLGLELGGTKGGWIGLTIAILLTGVLGWQAGNKFVKGHAGRFTAALWFGFSALCIYGYLAAGWVGLLALTLPSVALFWYGLRRLSAYILPLSDKRQQRDKAFRSLLTFTMGTNYPYYLVQDGKSSEQVPGNIYNQFFAGPGIVITSCDQVVYITNGIKVKGIREPGLTFTEMFDLPPKVVDLRPQLCAFDVDALTKDGIPVRVLTFVPFRIARGGQEPRLGQSFPFHPQAIYQAIAREPVEKRSQKADEQKHEWNTSLVPILAARIIQDAISTYTVDALCAADSPQREPRKEIVEQMREGLKKAMKPYGIEVIGGGISNLVPRDPCIVERRIENWQTEWERQILIELTEGEVERGRQIEEARAEAEAEIVLKLGRVVEHSLAEGTATQTALALRFIDCLGEIVIATENQWPPPPELKATLEQLRGKIASGRC